MEMANTYDTANCSSSSSPAKPDDFSVFLHQIMLRSSSSSSPSLMVQRGNEVQSFRHTYSFSENQDFGVKSSVASCPDRISVGESSSGLNPTSYGGFASPGPCFQGGVLNVSSSSVSIGTADNDLNEYDCESEEGVEGVVEEASAKPSPRNPSKRSRAAEVHNLSEKRRRSRINEKMKALQNLIPNSNKTDKASMLDEAIEYLKQLQLQVQLLTMRNGVNLYPMCSPGALQSNDISHIRMGYSEGSRPLNVNMALTPLHQDTPTNFSFALPDLYTNPKQTSVANLAKVNGSENSFGLESSLPIHLGTFQLPPPVSSKEIFMEEKLPCQLVKQALSRKNSVGYVAAEATSSLPFNEQESDLEEDTLEACIRGRDQSRGLLLTKSQ